MFICSTLLKRRMHENMALKHKKITLISYSKWKQFARDFVKRSKSWNKIGKQWSICLDLLCTLILTPQYLFNFLFITGKNKPSPHVGGIIHKTHRSQRLFSRVGREVAECDRGKVSQGLARQGTVQYVRGVEDVLPDYVQSGDDTGQHLIQRANGPGGTCMTVR